MPMDEIANNCICLKEGLLTADAAVKALEEFRRAGENSQSWDELYQCPSCGQYWEATYPAAGEVCCVEPQLIKLSPEEAKSRYKI